MAHRLFFYLTLLLLDASSARAASDSIVPTSNFIDTITGYSDLSSCAADVLSTIVRAQSSGCGDDGALTSYTCFCTDSSRLFSFEISSAVSLTCKSLSESEKQVSSALEVWEGYCALGVQAGLATTTGACEFRSIPRKSLLPLRTNVWEASTKTGTSSASPAAGATTGAAQTGAASTLITSTTSATGTAASATSTASSTSDSSDNSRTTAIAAGVAVPVGVIGLALVGYLFYRKRQQGKGQHVPIDTTPTEMSVPPQKQGPVQEMPNNPVHELPGQTRGVHELGGDDPRHEADSDAWKQSG